MTRINKVILALSLTLTTTNNFAQQKATEFIGPEKGSLVIVGGGRLGPDIWARFIELAGGPDARIVVIPTAGEDSSLHIGKSFEKELLQNLGIQNVVVLHTRNPKIANTDSFVAPIKKATGIWFVGGRQWRLADAYLNTLAHKEFNALLNRGGVIGGTSAGATIQGSFLFRGDTKGNNVLVGDHTQGLDFIHNVAIDQHILRRNRQFDLAGFIKTRPELLGIGIDENTAVVVQKNTFEVIGNSYVAVYDGHATKTATEEAKPFTFLGKGQRYDLKERKLVPAPGNPATAN
ncbi:MULTISPECIES: cyanophycinase [Niastella]|uniref:Cyanophycinase n=1 Tax=Niastella soli TaxID=2821487 RepID=A0ABS3Z3N2_9BACT|nr:cyanophycinase [Niastella soli]MBO9204250.1 cyanophycinase [Niastella soli]